MTTPRPAPPPDVAHLAIEGVIGVGKTSFCQVLAEAWNGRLVLEPADENPFLPGFYKDRKMYAFQTQAWFLLSRYRQLSEMVGQQDLFHSLTISDYIFAKDRIFASINLNDDELALYNRIIGALETQVPRADVVVYLQASTDVLLQRIEKRGRPYEFNIDPDYIKLLNKAYNHYFFHYTDSPLLVVNTDAMDFINDRDDQAEIMEQIAAVKPGATYYQPLRAKDRAALKVRRASEKQGPAA
jgi:deoxyadenosine/deoxycytidine kinase